MKHSPNSHVKTYFIIWSLLLLFTGITVWSAKHDFGFMNMYIAMAIATFKATIVALYFMHLKEDSTLNKAVFLSSFAFFAIFIFLTVVDFVGRSDLQPAKVTQIEVPIANLKAKMEELRKTTPALVEKGKTLFATNCATCHGKEGKGDGIVLNPPPRNFTSADNWKNGRAPAQIFHTLSNGLGSMPNFSGLPVEDRWALVHFVRTLGPNPPEDNKETLALIGLGDNQSSAAPKETPIELPVDFIIERMVEEAGQ